MPKVAKKPAAAAPKAAPSLTTIAIPRIGAPLTVDEAGRFGGIARGPADAKDHVIKVLDARPAKLLTHAQALKWAESIGGSLPSREEGRILFATVPELFEKDWYWLEPPCAGNEGYAWYQSFGNGDQGYNHKDYRLRAFAVRRLPI